MELRCFTAIFLVSVWVLPGVALAEDDEDMELSGDDASGSSADPWERPPEDQEVAPKDKGEDDVAQLHGDGRPLQVGLALGWGFETEKNKFGAHPYGLGGGLRAGYTLDMGVFVGLSTTYFLGSSNDNPPVGLVASSTNNSVSTWLINLDLGYDLWLGPVIFRPGAELGMALTFLSYDQRTGGSSTRGAVVIAPGAALLFPFDELYLGGDMRLLIPFTDSAQGTITLMAVGGMRFETRLF